MRQKAQLMDEAALNRALMRISHEIAEKNKGAEKFGKSGLTGDTYACAMNQTAPSVHIQSILLPRATNIAQKALARSLAPILRTE